MGDGSGGGQAGMKVRLVENEKVKETRAAGVCT